MDASKSLQILHARSVVHDPEKEGLYSPYSEISSDHDEGHEKPSHDSVTGLLFSMKTIELLNVFTTLQGERVQVRFMLAQSSESYPIFKAFNTWMVGVFRL
jgi:hypothetical protein